MGFINMLTFISRATNLSLRLLRAARTIWSLKVGLESGFGIGEVSGLLDPVGWGTLEAQWGA